MIVDDLIAKVAAMFQKWRAAQAGVAMPDAASEIADDPEIDFAADLARLIFATPIRVTTVPSTTVSNGRHEARDAELASAIVGFQPNRLRIRLRNMSTDTIAYVGFSGPNASSTTGFPIAAGATIELETQAAIHVRTAAGGTATIAYLIEYGD